MAVIDKPVVFSAALAGAFLLQTTGFAPVRDAPFRIAPDSFARAVHTGNAHLFELSITEQADVNAPDIDGRTPLLISVLRRDTSVVQRLLDLGADVDRADNSGRTPLMVAAGDGDAELLRQLLPRSKNATAKDFDGRSAAHYAIATRQQQTLELLLPAISQPDLFEELLALTCEAGDLNMSEAILNAMPVIDDPAPQIRRALMAAISSQNADLTRRLLSKHPVPLNVEGSSIPLLAQAIVDEDTETFHTLLHAGVDPNTTLPFPSEKQFTAKLPGNFVRSYVAGDQGVTVLMLAAGLGRVEYVRALLDAGADRNRQTARYKMLALYFAARTQKAKIVQMLLGRGPSPEELRVEISLATQKASVIKNGVAVMNTSVSTGRKGFDTPAGEYVITDKNRSHRSTLYHVEMPFFMRLNCLDFGMHAGVVPNYPASHGCIRLPASAAEKLFAELPVGTVVTIN